MSYGCANLREMADQPQGVALDLVFVCSEKASGSADQHAWAAMPVMTSRA